jgi:hypothetical protein
MEPFDRIHEEISGKRRSKAAEDLPGIEKLEDEWGFDRTVFRIKTSKYGEEYEGKVLKVGAGGKNSRNENRKELETWMAVKSRKKLGKHFCPIRDRGKNFKWIIMDYAPSIKSFLSRIKSRKKQKKIKNTLAEVEEYLDLKHENMGFHENRGVVFIDYPWGGNFVTEKEEKTIVKLLNGVNRLASS